MKNSFLIFALIFGININYSQNYVYDIENKQPISFVNIQYGLNQGLITNDDVFFELPKNIKNDSVLISHILYQSKYLKIQNIKKYDTVNNLRVGIYKDESYNYNLSAKLAINNIKVLSPVKVETNYNLSKDFSKVVRKFDNLDS